MQTNGDIPIERIGDKETLKNSRHKDNGNSSKSSKKEKGNSTSATPVVRRERPSRACTIRSAKVYVDSPVIQRKPPRPKPAVKRGKKKAVAGLGEEEAQEEEDGDGGVKGQCGKNIVTPLVNTPSPEMLSRWNLRAMWELGSILNFLNVFRHLLKITADFSAEELESALLNPNSTLGDIHIPLLKAIPPVTRMACGRETWVTVLCRKLRDWWHWVADGELPIVASQGAEIDHYRSLDPHVRVVILKALCDIRVEQDDIRQYIDYSVKHGVHLSAFRKERIGGDSHGISYWYEDDPIIGHRLYREIRKVEVKRVKAKGSHVLPNATYEWETVATNLDEFQDVSEKLFTSQSKTEASLGKKLKNDMLPEIEKIHKRKEKLLKKQQREALLLDNLVTMDGMAGRSLRDRKRVTYTFDDYERSINEAIKITKRKQSSPETNNVTGEGVVARSEPSNGTWHGPSDASDHISFSPPSPSSDYDNMEEGDKSDDQLDLSNRRGRRRRPQRYTDKEFIDNDADYVDTEDDIVGEAVYDDDYVRKRKHVGKISSSSEAEAEGDEEYRWSDEEEDDAEEEEELFSMSDEEEESDDEEQRYRKIKKLPGRTRGETKSKLLRSGRNHNVQSGLRRSRRSTQNRINYRQYELSESEPESSKQEEPPDSSESRSDASENDTYSMDGGEESDEEEDRDGDCDKEMEEKEEMGIDDQSVTVNEGCSGVVEKKEEDGTYPSEPNSSSSSMNVDGVGVRERRFLDLNELAPGSNFDDPPSVGLMKDDDEEDTKGDNS